MGNEKTKRVRDIKVLIYDETVELGKFMKKTNEEIQSLRLKIVQLNKELEELNKT